MSTDPNLRNTPVSLRLPKDLKEKVAELAKIIDTSLNDLSIQALTEFVERHEREQVKNNEIPTAEEAEKLLSSHFEEMIAFHRNIVKSSIQEMLSSGERSTIVDLFGFNKVNVNVSDFNQKKIADKLGKELQELGYYVHTFENKSLEDFMYHFNKNFLGICLDEPRMLYFKEIDDELLEIPF